MIHVVKNRILLNDRPRDSSLVPITPVTLSAVFTIESVNESFSKYHIPLLHSTRLHYVAGKESGKCRNELPYELSFLSLLIYSCTSCKLSEFIQSDAPSNTLLLIPNEFVSEQYLNWAFNA